MAIFELRTYTVIVGKMAEVVELYKTQGWPALAKHPVRLVGYFTDVAGEIAHQPVRVLGQRWPALGLVQLNHFGHLANDDGVGAQLKNSQGSLQIWGGVEEQQRTARPCSRAKVRAW